MNGTAGQVIAQAPGVTPTIDEVREVARRSTGEYRTVPIYREVFADMETPVSVYLKLTGGTRTPGFLLESVEGGTTIARYSFIGANVAATVLLQDGELEVVGELPGRPDRYDDPLEAIQEIITPFRTEANPKLPRFTGGAVGYLSYDAIRRFEPRVPQPSGPGLGLPEASFHIADTLVVFDHLERVLKVVTHVPLDGGKPVDQAYEDAVTRIDGITDLLRDVVPEYPIAPEGADGDVASRSVPNMSLFNCHAQYATFQQDVKAQANDDSGLAHQ